MEWVCLGIIIIGALILLYGSVLFLVVAFRDNFFWGLASLLVPVAGLFYLVKNWEETKSPFVVQVIGGLILGAGLFWASFH